MRARHWEALTDQAVLCRLCPQDCRIPEGERGVCGVRYNRDGTLFTLAYDKIVSQRIEPVEKKPLFHFLPDSRAWSFATVGCNLACTCCEDWDLSQWPKEHLPMHTDGARGDPRLEDVAHAILGKRATPKSIVEQALRSGCESIAYTFTEPTIFFELAYDTALLARERGLRNIFVTNGFTSEAPQREIAPLLDAVSVSLKCFKPETSEQISRAPLDPVLAAIRRYVQLGVWTEVSTLVIPGLNDSDEELRGLASFVASLGPHVPWHLTQFFPAHELVEKPVTPAATLRRAVEVGRSAGLRYVYAPEVPGEGLESTGCWKCGRTLIERGGQSVRVNRLVEGACPYCGTAVHGVELGGE